MPKQYSHEKSEWSYLVDVEDLERGPKTFTFTASDEERGDLARRLGIVSVEMAEASITLQRVGGGVVQAMGTIRADVTQSCVVSLVPVKNRIEEEFEGWFGDKNNAVSFAKARNEREAKKGHTEMEVMEESVDPEPIIGGRVDVGELATQYLSLFLDPYPHADGVSGEFVAGPQPEKDGAGAAIRKNPFEALKDWKEKR